MQINKFKKVGKNKYRIFFDNTELTLYEDIILKYDLLINKNIDISLLDKLIDENNYYDAYDSALSYVEIKLRCKKEIIDYLNRKGFNKLYIDYTLDKLEKLNILDDVKYTDAFINDKILLSNDGPFKIKKQLLDLEIESEIIDNKLNSIENDIWKQKIQKLISKKSSSIKNKGYYMVINKLQNDLFNLGYEKSMIDENLTYIEYDNTIFDKEFEKAFQKFKEDRVKITNYLLRKGFTYEQINSKFN